MDQNTIDSVELLQTQLKFTLWFIGILMSIVAFFIMRGFKAQQKKDDAQDEQLGVFTTLMNKLSDAITSIDKSTAINTEILKRHENHLEKHDRILENLAGATKVKR